MNPQNKQLQYKEAEDIILYIYLQRNNITKPINDVEMNSQSCYNIYLWLFYFFFFRRPVNDKLHLMLTAAE